MRQFLIFATSLMGLSACSSEIYLRDGVTDGDTFYLAQRALVDNDPALQAWVTYSLAKSTCQLEIGGTNPARNSSYECELGSRRVLATTWIEKTDELPDIEDRYLDDLAVIHNAGFLPEYVARHFGKTHWALPPDLRKDAYQRWQRKTLRRHRIQTRITGSWNYAHKVGPRL